MSQPNWQQIGSSELFHSLVAAKRRFIVPATIFFLLFYFVLPVLTAFTTSLSGKAFGSVTWAYVYAFAQFAMTWILAHLYLRKAHQFDRMADQIKREFTQGSA